MNEQMHMMEQMRKKVVRRSILAFLLMIAVIVGAFLLFRTEAIMLLAFVHQSGETPRRLFILKSLS